MPAPGSEGAVWCEDCFEWTYEQGGQTWYDASCCIDGGGWCDSLAADPNASKMLNNTDSCYEAWINNHGYVCAEWAGGGIGCQGDGEDECTIPVGQACPIACSSCEQMPE